MKNLPHIDREHMQPDYSDYSPTATQLYVKAAKNTRTRKIFLVAQMAHLAIYYLLMGVGYSPDLLIHSGVACIALYSWLLVSEVKNEVGVVSPYIFYLSASIFRLGIGVIYATTVYATGDTWVLRVGVYDVTPWLVQGHYIAMVGDLCFVVGYVILQRVYSKRLKSHVVRQSVTKRGWRIGYLAGLACAVMALLLRFGIGYKVLGGMGGIGQIVGYIMNYGAPAGAYLMLFSVYSRRKPWLSHEAVLAFLIVLINLAMSFSSYMKTDTFVSTMPFILIGLEILRTKWKRVRDIVLGKPVILLLIIGYALIFVLSGYSDLRRSKFYDLSYKSDVPSVMPDLKKAVIGAIPGTEEFHEIHAYPRDGAWHLVGRMLSTHLTAWSYSRVEQYGTRQGSFWEAVAVSITPRLLWPDKPEISPGKEFAVFVGDARSIESATTATALTMHGSYYWWGGYVGLVIGMLFSGGCFSYIWAKIREDVQINPVSSIVMMILYFYGIHWFESAFTGAIPFYMYILIVFFPARIAYKKFFKI